MSMLYVEWCLVEGIYQEVDRSKIACSFGCLKILMKHYLLELFTSSQSMHQCKQKVETYFPTGLQHIWGLFGLIIAYELVSSDKID
jgi:hypothetical protein